ncbi:conserved protein of unknown function [Burkholderia multivorans]
MMSTAVTTRLTPASDRRPNVVKLKVFWKTARKWTETDIAAYHDAAPQLAKQIQDELYWHKTGQVRSNRFTCEDFALRVLAQFASSRGLPLKLETGVRTYRNMEIYGQPEHDRYDSTMYGITEMVGLTYGASDMQRSHSNTTRLSGPETLLSGDILAQANDRAGVAHHIQLVLDSGPSTISIMQGNSSGVIVRPFTSALRLLGLNRADPQNNAYAGMLLERGHYTRRGSQWDYTNTTTGTVVADFLKIFQLYRWNFAEFNR